MEKTIIDDLCPKCNGKLRSMPGHALSATDGVTVDCPNFKCGMADWGHGKTVKEAVSIFQQKCRK